MRECAKIKRLLNRYIDKELDRQGSSRIEGHIKECASCKEELDKLYIVKGLIENRQRKSLPEDYLIYRIRERIRVSLQEGPKLQWLFDMGSLSKKLIPVPALAFALLALVFSFTLKGYRTGDLLGNYLSHDDLTQREINLLGDSGPSLESIAQLILEGNEQSNTNLNTN